jgi:peptide/nickel transport system permease protein
MGRYIVRRLLQAIPLLFIISVILFALSVKMGDPLATFGGRQVIKSEDRKRLTRQLGLDKPLYVQYVVWLAGNDWMTMDVNGDGKPDVDENGKLVYGTRKGVLRGDLGTSFVTKQPVIDMIKERLPNTLLLMLTSEVVILIFALVIGLASALRQYSIFDHTVTALSFIGYSMPIPLLALGLIYIFAVYFKRWGLPYFPTGGMFDPQAGPGWQQTLWHMVLPVTAISVISIAGYSRYVRGSMLEVIQQDYIRTARAKGLAERRVVFVHALKNAALPLVTVVGLDLPFLLAGAVVTETIFAWPGMGRLFYDHTTRSDFPVLMGIIMIISVAVVIFQLLTDLTYTYLDPRIRYD